MATVTFTCGRCKKPMGEIKTDRVKLAQDSLIVCTKCYFETKPKRSYSRKPE